MTTALINDDVRLAQAAKLLNVTPEHLLYLLDLGEVSLDHLAEYKKKQRSKSQQALQQLIDQAQELNMGY